MTVELTNDSSLPTTYKSRARMATSAEPRRSPAGPRRPRSSSSQVTTPSIARSRATAKPAWRAPSPSVGTTRPGEPRAPAGRSRRRRPAGRGPGSRRPGSRGRAARSRRRRPTPGRRCRQRARATTSAELLEQVGHQVGLGVDRGVRVERVAEAVRGCRAGHELRDPTRARGGNRERIEAGLGHELGGKQPGRDVPARGGASGPGSREGTNAGSEVPARSVAGSGRRGRRRRAAPVPPRTRNARPPLHPRISRESVFRCLGSRVLA